MFSQRAKEAFDIFSSTKGIKVNLPRGAFYMTVLFENGVLNDHQTLPIADPDIKAYIESIVQDVPPDKRFIYYLLGGRGICAVPLTGFCSDDGRDTILMRPPECVFRTVQHSWHPDDWQEDSPWMRLFRNARVWVG